MKRKITLVLFSFVMIFTFVFAITFSFYFHFVYLFLQFCVKYLIRLLKKGDFYCIITVIRTHFAKFCIGAFSDELF